MSIMKTPRLRRAAPRPAATGNATNEQQLAALVAQLEPACQKVFVGVRRSLRKQFPTAFEIVYDYAHSLVLAVGPTDRGYEATFSIAAEAGEVKLYFLHGPELPDPQRLLRGEAKLVRYVQVPSVATLRKPAVAQLIQEALVRGKPMPKTGGGELLVKAGAKAKRARPQAKALPRPATAR